MSTIKNIVIWHSDLDGCCAAAVVSKFLGDVPKKFYKIQYGQGFPMSEIDANTDVWVVDFAIYPDILFDIDAKCHKLYWYDHHAASMRIDRKMLQRTEGMVDVERAGCRIVWDELFKSPAPWAVKLVEDWDMWKFNEKGTKSFKSYVSLMFDDPQNQMWNVFLSEDDYANKSVADSIFKGEILLLAEKKRIEKAMTRGFWGTMLGHKTFYVNASEDISSLGEAVYLSTTEPVIVAIYQVVGETEMVFSLRSNQIDVREVAEKFRGGGHAFAAGFTIKNDFSELQKKFGNYNF